jgi:hypothetical protein
MHVCCLFYMVSGYRASYFCPIHPTGILASMNVNSFQTYWSCIKIWGSQGNEYQDCCLLKHFAWWITNISKEHASSPFVTEEYVLSKKYWTLLSLIHFLPAYTTSNHRRWKSSSAHSKAHTKQNKKIYIFSQF